jgi:tetratricopeptide (TPR) repeat protein
MFRTRHLNAVICGAMVWIGLSAAQAAQPAPKIPSVADLPPKPPEGFTQELTPSFVVETDVSQAFTHKIAGMVSKAEAKFYNLFKITPEYMNGISKQYIDNKYHIPGTFMSLVRRSYVEVRVYKTEETFANEWFDNTGVTDKLQRLRQGLPGAYTGPRHEKDSDGKPIGKTIMIIRSFVANRDDDEIERTLLHEMGHVFMQAFLLEYFGAPPPGQEGQKRGCPAWLGEGVAQLFENRWSNAASAQKARLRQEGMIYEAAKIGDSYPFEEFTNITNAHNLQAVAGDPLKATLNYAQSASVMDFMVNVNGAMFFNFLENLRASSFEKNLSNQDRNHVGELFSFQNDCFKKAFNADLSQVEGYWKDHIKKTMEAQLKKQPELYYWIGEYYLRRGKDKQNDLVKAEENFNLAMTQAPTKGEGYLGMGRMAIRKHDDDNALKYLTKATELNPKDEDAWYYLGIAQVNVGKLKEAVESLTKSVKIYPLNHIALAGLGLAQFHSGEYEKAMENYEKAYQAFRNPYYLFQKGHAAFFGKKYREAQQGFAQFCDWFPQDAQGQMWYGLAAWRLNDKDFAMKKLDEASKLNPQDPTIIEAIARAKRGETLTFAIEKPDVPEVKPAVANPTEKPKKPDIRIEDE